MNSLPRKALLLSALSFATVSCDNDPQSLGDTPDVGDAPDVSFESVFGTERVFPYTLTTVGCLKDGGFLAAGFNLSVTFPEDQFEIFEVNFDPALGRMHEDLQVNMREYTAATTLSEARAIEVDQDKQNDLVSQVFEGVSDDIDSTLQNIFGDNSYGKNIAFDGANVVGSGGSIRVSSGQVLECFGQAI